jgi:hypothetical protein
MSLASQNYRKGLQMTTETKKERLTFICECNGCRAIPKAFDSYYVEAIAEEVNGYYFSPATRRWFGVRLTGFVKLSSGGVIIKSTQKAGFADSDGREINHAYICKYGNFVTDYRYKTATQARKGLFEGSEAVAECSCHGCQIDRAGR